jgi:hypothetical protein
VHVSTLSGLHSASSDLMHMNISYLFLS